MNTLSQLESGILGDELAVSALAGADAARILVLSDTHGHFGVFDAILRKFGPTCDALLFAGDGMWDIVQYIENAQESEKIRDALPPVVAFVAGNGDGDQYRVSLGASVNDSEEDDAPGYSLTVPDRQIVRACGYGILIVHGHRHSVDYGIDVLVDTAHALDCDIAVYGHTHIPFTEEFSGIVALNPGSPARPRGHSESGFAVIELDATSTVPKIEFYLVNEGVRGNFYFDNENV